MPRGRLVRSGLSAVLLASLWYFSPPMTPAFRVCGFHWLTGRDCPLCGVTRAMFALAKGHWREAIDLNALSPLAFVMLFGLFWNGPMVGRIWAAGVAAFGIYGVCRIFLL